MIKKLRRNLNDAVANLPDWFGYLLLAIVVAPVICGGAAGVFMLLWNYLLVWLIPAIPEIDFWRVLTIEFIWIVVIMWKTREDQ